MTTSLPNNYNVFVICFVNTFSDIALVYSPFPETCPDLLWVVQSRNLNLSRLPGQEGAEQLKERDSFVVWNSTLPPFTRTVALLIFVTSDQFCQAVRLILPGSPTNFEIGIFLPLCLILCNSCSIVGQRAWQNQWDCKNWTDFGCSCKWAISNLLSVCIQSVHCNDNLSSNHPSIYVKSQQVKQNGG